MSARNVRKGWGVYIVLFIAKLQVYWSLSFNCRAARPSEKHEVCMLLELIVGLGRLTACIDRKLLAQCSTTYDSWLWSLYDPSSQPIDQATVEPCSYYRQAEWAVYFHSLSSEFDTVSKGRVFALQMLYTVNLYRHTVQWYLCRLLSLAALRQAHCCSPTHLSDTALLQSCTPSRYNIVAVQHTFRTQHCCKRLDWGRTSKESL